MRVNAGATITLNTIYTEVVVMPIPRINADIMVKIKEWA